MNTKKKIKSIKSKKDLNISAVIIAKNEEEKVVDCIKSVLWCGEIILIDTGSTDKTVELAKKLGAKVYKYEKGGYSDWRNEGLKRAGKDWILYIDTDERVTPVLCEEIKDKLRIKNSEFGAYAIPRRNIILGREMKHGGWWPDYVKRLFRKNKLKKWTGDLHEEPVHDGFLGHLENSLIHIKEDNLSDMVEKTNQWSEIEAKLMFDSDHPKMNLARFMTAISREFWFRMVKRSAFLDGTEGIIFGLYQVYSRFISYAKLWEMQEKVNSEKLKVS
jgi:glycosyltransferase involved in cell wall biosynthesis